LGKVAVSFAGAGNGVVFTRYVKVKAVGLAVGDWAREGRAPVNSIATRTMVFKAYFVMRPISAIPGRNLIAETLRYTPPILMQRRTLLGWAAALGSAVRFSGLRAWAQTAGFPAEHADVVRALAAVALPSELGAEGVDRVAADFGRWVREYRPGAEMDHGYGFTRIRRKPTSPVPGYLRQLADLRAVLLTGDGEQKRAAVRAALEQAKVTDLPRTPGSQHVAADLMAFYFRSSDANDLCYRAAIGRDLCRGLKGSDYPPPPLKEKL